MFKFIGWLFLIIVVMIVMILFFTFGPWVYADHKNCMDPVERNISKKVMVYERTLADKKSYIRYQYDASYLCVDIYKNGNMCKDYSNKYVYIPIQAKKVLFTGRVMKTHSFNAFTSDSYTLEVIINNKRYWISTYAFDDMTFGMSKDWPRYATSFKVKNC